MTKENYLNAIASWKAFINDGKHKKYKVYYDGYRVENPEEHWSKQIWTKIEQYRWESDLTVHHHVFHTLLRRKSLQKAFDKAEDTEGWVNTLKSVAQYSQQDPSFQRHSVNWSKAFIEKILKPYGGYVTIEDFIEVVNNV